MSGDRRRLTHRLGSSLQLRATGALLAAYLVVLPLALAAAAEAAVSAASAGSARSERQLQADLGRLDLDMARQDAGVRAYALTGDRAFLAGYDAGRRDAVAAWAAARAEAAGAGLTADLAPAGTAMDAWQRWADARAAAGPPPAPDAAGLAEGARLLDAWRSAAADLDRRAAAAAGRDDAAAAAARQFVLLGDELGPVVGNGAMVVLAVLLLAAALRPVSRLAGLAAGLAAGERTPVPGTGRPDEVGSLARSLVRCRQAEASRQAILEHSPVGLFTLGPDLAMADVNPALREMFAVPPEGMSFSSLDVFVHPEDRPATEELGVRLLSGASDHERVEGRFIRAGGAGEEFWGRLTVAVVRGPDGAPQRYVCMMEDITEHRERVQRAARVQRDLLPEAAPDLPGYELAGLCRPGREISGDFYDWQLGDPSGLVVTLGDVSGRDMPAALVMAIVRTALRTGAAGATAGDAVRSVAAATGRYLERAGAFVRLFHGRLDPAAGTLTYVDAGHGLAVVVGPGGARRVHGSTSLPLGVLDGPANREETARLAPGEALVLLSDGVLDVHPELGERLELAGELLTGAASAREMAERLTSAAGVAADDVTVLVLRRAG